MWQSRNKIDLIIEVWEKLDCESVGSSEIEAIEEAVRGRFGDAAVDSPMAIARLLADEGADLRHSEIMELYLARRSDRPYDAPLLNLIDTTSLAATLRSIRNAENLRRKFASDNDRTGMRLLREEMIKAKQAAAQASQDRKRQPAVRSLNAEIAQWLTLWLQSPELFENWVTLRKTSADFIRRFGEI